MLLIKRLISLLTILFVSLTSVPHMRAQVSSGNEANRAAKGTRLDAIDTPYLPRDEQRQWARVQMTGPFGGDVASLAIDPRHGNNIFAGTFDGQMFHSTDGGVIWRRVKPGLQAAGFALTVILFDREREGVIYVGGSQVKDARDDISGGGVFRSDDGGETWRELEAMRGRSVRGLVQSASDTTVLLAAARDGIYRTSDRGATWKRITPESDAELRGFHSVAVDPRNANTIYVGTSHLPWKTTDGGRTWKRAGSKETGMIDDSDIFAIRIDESNPDTLFMSACSGIYASTNASAKWTKLQGIPYTSRRTHVIYQHPTRPQVVFAGTTEGLWRTTDGGKTWGLMTSRQLIINAVAVSPEHPDQVYLGTDDFGILVSNNGGETYEPSNAGFINRQVRAVLPDRVERGRVYAGVIFDGQNGGLFVSEDGGITWQQSTAGMGVRDVYSLYQSESHPETIYAGTNHGIFRSDDHGRNWQPVVKSESETPEQAERASDQPRTNQATTVTRPRAVTPKPTPPVKRIAQTRAKNGTQTRTTSGAKSSTAKKTPSTNRTQPASAATRPKPQPSAVDEANKLVDLQNQVFTLTPFTPRDNKQATGLIAATWDGLFRTYDEKKGWQRIRFEIPGMTTPSRTAVHVVTTSSRAPGLIFIGTEHGLFVSRDDGETFTPLPLNGEARKVSVIALDPRDPKMMYVGTSNGFFRSTDGGQTWEQRGGGMRLQITVSAMTINPVNPDELYLGDFDQGGFYFSRDRGKNWEPLNINSLPSWRLWSLIPDPFDGHRLYAGSFSGGVYVMTRSTPSSPQ